VEVRFEPAGPGTLLTIRHGTYGEGDQKERAGHIEGWQFFVGRLQELMAGESPES
jgi:hypothetical protein